MTNGSFPDIEKKYWEKIVLGKFITIYEEYKSTLFSKTLSTFWSFLTEFPNILK